MESSRSSISRWVEGAEIVAVEITTPPRVQGTNITAVSRRNKALTWKIYLCEANMLICIPVLSLISSLILISAVGPHYWGHCTTNTVLSPTKQHLAMQRGLSSEEPSSFTCVIWFRLSMLFVDDVRLSFFPPKIVFLATIRAILLFLRP